MVWPKQTCPQCEKSRTAREPGCDLECAVFHSVDNEVQLILLEDSWYSDSPGRDMYKKSSKAATARVCVSHQMLTPRQNAGEMDRKWSEVIENSCVYSWVGGWQTRGIRCRARGKGIGHEEAGQVYLQGQWSTCFTYNYLWNTKNRYPISRKSVSKLEDKQTWELAAIHAIAEARPMENQRSLCFDVFHLLTFCFLQRDSLKRSLSLLTKILSGGEREDLLKIN